jgi:hypothetical protein
MLCPYFGLAAAEAVQSGARYQREQEDTNVLRNASLCSGRQDRCSMLISGHPTPDSVMQGYQELLKGSITQVQGTGAFTQTDLDTASKTTVVWVHS